MMRSIWVSLALSACVSTTLEPGASHPANPDAATARAEHQTAVLEPGFEPFERYAEPAAQESDPHAHHGHAEDDKTQTSGDVYTCPMHPEVKQNGPGRCPKCGMKLVPAKKGAP